MVNASPSVRGPIVIVFHLLAFGVALDVQRFRLCAQWFAVGP